MQKPLALSIAACLALAGCQVFDKSDVWEQAVRVRPGETTRDADPSNAYAAKLHAAFAGRGVEHKVVVYQYRYTTRLREEAVGTRTAVIYRDNSNARYQWWLKDDRLNTPVWLPNGDLDKQVSFYLRRKAEVIDKKEYPGQGGSAKTSLAFARPSPALRAAAKPQPQVAMTRIVPVQKAIEPVVARKPAPTPKLEIAKAPEARKPVQKVVVVQRPVIKPVPKPTPVIAKAPEARKPVQKVVVVQRPMIKPVPEPTPVIAKVPEVSKPVQKVVVAQPPAIKEPAPKAAITKIKPAFRAAPASSFSNPPPAPATEEAPPEPIASRSSVPWSPPSVLDAKEQSDLTAPRDAHLERLFRAKHGSDYNRFSPSDRRKMQQLQKGVASSE